MQFETYPAQLAENRRSQKSENPVASFRINQLFGRYERRLGSVFREERDGG